ncbi:MAG: hypothetical protein IJ615_03430 [Bacteroidaceae bacterium]|nr:hypothetical protein [Bacteroidaceae bacterium]
MVERDTSCFLHDDNSCFAGEKVISKAWKYISVPWKYILVALKYISVPLKKFCSVGWGICVRVAGNLFPEEEKVWHIATEGAKRVILGSEK